jgi:hypothetical protein
MLRILTIISLLVVLPCCAQDDSLNAPAPTAPWTIDAGQNAEISSWLAAETRRRLSRLPDTVPVQVRFDPVLAPAGRAGWLFLAGRQTVSLSLHYQTPRASGTVKQDTSWLLGYCGVLKCNTSPMGAAERLQATKTVAVGALEQLAKKLYKAYDVAQEEPEKSSSSPQNDR